MTEQAEKLREALQGYSDFADICDPPEPQEIAAAICDTLGITRDDAMVFRDGATNDQPYPTVLRAARYLRVADALSTLLEVAGR